MSIGAWQIVIVLGIIGFIIFRNIKNRPVQKLDKRTQAVHKKGVTVGMGRELFASMRSQVSAAELGASTCV